MPPNDVDVAGSSLLASVNQNGVEALNAILQTLRRSFPQTVGTATTATAGAQTLPANPAGFLSLSLPDGTQVRVPYYLP